MSALERVDCIQSFFMSFTLVIGAYVLLVVSDDSTAVALKITPLSAWTNSLKPRL